LIIAGRLPDLGAGSRRFKSSRPDQSPFETKLRKETATAKLKAKPGYTLDPHNHRFELRLGKPEKGSKRS
jgi:hypothetical protein